MSTLADEEAIRVAVLHEIDNLIELSEQNRRTINPAGTNNSLQSSNQNQSEVGRVSLDGLDLQGSDDIVNDERPIS